MLLKIHRIPAFSVIGKEGSTHDGPGFVGRLWQKANEQFAQVAPLAKRSKDGNFIGFWGAMTDFSRSFRPWEDGFTQGLYLAGIECIQDAVPPTGWVRWDIPGFDCIKLPCQGENTFSDGLALLKANGLSLAGAVHDFTDPVTGENAMLFPVRIQDDKQHRCIG